MRVNEAIGAMLAKAELMREVEAAYDKWLRAVAAEADQSDPPAREKEAE